MVDKTKDPILCEMARVLRDGRSRLPSVTFEQAYAQAERSLRGNMTTADSGSDTPTSSPIILPPHDPQILRRRAPIMMWTRGLPPVEDAALEQLARTAELPFIHHHIAVMPDVHLGIGATVGSVVPTSGALVPAAVGVDIGCGMQAVRTNLTASDLPDDLHALRTSLEAAVPHGRTDNGGPGDRGAWGSPPAFSEHRWFDLGRSYAGIVDKHPSIQTKQAPIRQLGTLGTGNHFLEISLDLQDRVWIVLHSGSRGVGNRIGTYFIEQARKRCQAWSIDLPHRDLAYLPDTDPLGADYIEAVRWAQAYARSNRDIMMEHALAALRGHAPTTGTIETIDCHHNYMEREHHYGKDIWVTRKGAVRAREGDLGIIPGSMGARSFIVRGRGAAASFCSCSHGAGRLMSRTEAKRRFSVEDHVAATEGIECRKDVDVVDETPAAYKSIEAVMAAQADLVEVVHELRQIVNVKG